MNVWDRFGVRSISPTQLTTFQDEPAIWMARYLRKVRDDAGPAAWRGDAVEWGMYTDIMKPAGLDPLAEAYRTYETRSEEYSAKHEGEVHPQYDEYRAEIEVTLQRGIEAMKALDYGVPRSYQSTVNDYLPGCNNIKLFGKPDLVFDWGCLDIKTTGRMPSKPAEGVAAPKDEHCMQFSCYAAIRKDTLARGLYISTAGKPKAPWVLTELDSSQIDFHARRAAYLVRTMERRMTAAIALSEYECITPEEALAELCAPNFAAKGGGTYPLWKEDFTRAAIEAVPEWGI